jgi:EAL domain-containing protein (putative c-di-GMP-specific phosphodiesterase class I)
MLPSDPYLTHAALLVLMFVPSAAVLARAATVPGARLAWAAFGTALTLNSIGLAITLAHDLQGQTPSFLGAADAFWIAQYPALLVGFAALARERVRRPPLTLALDALMVILVMCALVTAAVLPSVAADRTELSALAVVVNLAYPVGDGILVAIAITGVVALGWRRTPVWSLLSLGTIALFLGDVGWLLSAAAGTWEAGMATNALFPLWAILFAVAAWTRGAECRLGVGDGSDVRLLFAALVAVLSAILLLVVNEWLAVHPVAVTLAALGLLAAINRTAFALSSGLRVSRDAARDRATVGEVRDALRAGELTLHFQPLIDVRTGRACGAEALLRWPRPGGFVPPDAFLPAVEQSPLIGPLSDFVLDRAIAELAGWRAAGHELGVSVNLAVANLAEPDLPERISTLLDRHDVPPDRLTLEITETAAGGDDAATLRVLGALASLGVELAIDDFGTGHSSLARVAHFPIDELKIDRSFVRDIDSGAWTIVGTTIQLAHSLGLRVVAEGVESEAVLTELHRLGCDVAQGFHVSRPLPAADFAAWLTAHAASGRVRAVA